MKLVFPQIQDLATLSHKTQQGLPQWTREREAEISQALTQAGAVSLPLWF